jgi:hypothetical protein
MITHQEFLIKLRENNIHYKNKEFEVISEFKKMKDHLLVEDKFGLLKNMPYDLLQGRKPTIQSALNKYEYIINKFNYIHTNKYVYEKFYYLKETTEFEFICPKHGIMKTLVRYHLRHGCPKCGMEQAKSKQLKSLIDFINQSNVVHDNKYNYFSSIYINDSTKLNITCPIHGDFLQTPNKHLQSRGCKKCSGENNNFKKLDWISKKGIATFYILYRWNENEKFYKYGICTGNVENRFNSKTKMPYNYTIEVKIQNFDRSIIWETEEKYKKNNLLIHYKPEIYFKGSSECVTNINYIL